MAIKTFSRTQKLDSYFSKVWSPQGLIFFVGLTFVTAGIGPIGDFVNWVLDQNYFPEMNYSNQYFQFGILILSLICCSNQIRLFYRKYQYSNIQNSYFFFAIVLWLMFRFYPHKGWQFTTLKVYSDLYLWDIIIASNLIYWVFSFHKSRILRKSLSYVWKFIEFLKTRLLEKIGPTSDNIFYFFVINILWILMYGIIKDIIGFDLNDILLNGLMFILGAYLLMYMLFLFFWLSDYIETELKKNDQSNKTFFSEDTPIAPQKDIQSNPVYEKIAVDLATKLTTQTFRKAFSVGIVGPWGAGKSSFINHVIQIAENHDNGNKKIEPIIFYPAYNHSPEQIINDFFATLIESLKKYDGRLKSTLISYSLKLVEATVNKKRDFQTILSPDNYLTRNRPVYQLYKDISEIIKSLPVKPIIVIDDIDRLKADEILEVLRIIRNTANFPNTVFLVAFDKEFITQSLKEDNPCFSKNYIDKYFQLELYLPQNKNKTLRLYFLDLLFTRFKKVSSNKKRIYNEFKSDIVDPENVPFDRFCNNHRDVIRIFNSYILHIELLKGEQEIHYIDLLYFIILKSKYNSITNFIYRNFLDFFYLKEGGSRWCYKADVEKSNTDGDGPCIIETYFKDHPDIFNLSSIDHEELLLLLETLFGKFDGKSHNVSDPKLRIFAPNRTDIYFNLLLDSNTLPRVQFLNNFKTYPQIDFLNYLDEITNKKTHSILTKEIDDEIFSYTYSTVHNLNEFDNVIATHLYLKEHNNDLISLLDQLINFNDFKVQNISSVKEFFCHLIETFGTKNTFNITLEKRFEVYNLIDKQYSEAKKVEAFSSDEFNSKQVISHLPLRKQLVDEVINNLPTYDINYSNWIFSNLQSEDIDNKEVLVKLFEFVRVKSPKNPVSVSELTHEESTFLDLFKIIDADILIKNKVVESNSVLIDIYKINYFLHKDLPYKDRVFALKRILDSLEYIDCKKIGFSNEKEILDLRSLLLSQHLKDNPKFSIGLIELTASEMDVSSSETVREEFKRILFNSAENLRYFLEKFTFRKSKYRFEPDNAIDKIFISFLAFKNILEESKFNDLDFVKEYIKFLDVYILMHASDSHDTIFKFKHISINGGNIIDKSSNSYPDSMIVFKLLKVDYPVNLNHHDNNKSLFYLRRGEYILLYNANDNFDSIAKNYKKIYPEEELTLIDGKLKVNDDVVGETFYSSED
ncbi:KAP family NTPase [Ancylomarina sp. DW003]|nr:P-loop NTPase fold protein [Ancylomarina sp. DW003]MDE5423670.1 KAP family NTPase [Ancylomarina sp. DW003]